MTTSAPFHRYLLAGICALITATVLGLAIRDDSTLSWLLLAGLNASCQSIAAIAVTPRADRRVALWGYCALASFAAVLAGVLATILMIFFIPILLDVERRASGASAYLALVMLYGLMILAFTLSLRAVWSFAPPKRREAAS